MVFSTLGLAAPILKALGEEGYTTPTPIQAQAIPAVLGGSDLLGIAQTGTGKTAAFALPILHRLAADRRQTPRKGCRVLVLSPTRELASQISESFRVYGRHLKLSVATVFGGVGHRPQVQTLASGVDILVATPGRLLDHIADRAVILSGAEIFVLDEADQMLDMGFVKPIRQIVSHLPKQRQNLFFSATMPREIAGLADDLLRDPVKISVTPVATTADRVEQRVIHIEAAKKQALLVELLSDPAMERTLVFTRTKRGADRVTRHLDTAGVEAAAIHGNKSQKQREEALSAFKKGKIRVLVATDIAARGIDVDGVSHVINYELPEVPEAYVHRIGRTARAGAAGNAISLCDVEERDLLRAIERLTRQTIPSEDRRGGTLPSALPEARPDTRRDGRGRPSRGQQKAKRPQQQHQKQRSGANEGRPAASAQQPRSSGKPARSGGPAQRQQANAARPAAPGQRQAEPRDRWQQSDTPAFMLDKPRGGDAGRKHQKRRPYQENRAASTV
jgi:ATP-dependent RNA helicase RhlE